jgi:peptide/nickel transport system permease protein
LGRFVIRRLIGMVVLLFVVSIVTYGIFFATGTDPALRACGKQCTPQRLEQIHHKLGLDKPIFLPPWNSQYGTFVKGLVAGRDYDAGTDISHCPAPCFGFSFQNDEPVWTTMLNRLPVTVSLAIGAASIWLVTGVSVGIISALRKGKFVDRATMGVALAGVSLPTFLSALVALYIVCAKLQWLPYPSYTSPFSDPVAWFKGMILPWITLSFLYSALYARLTRANMLETLNEDFIRTARAKGLPERTVIVKHGLRAALTPIVTIFGLDLGGLLGGAILTESVYGLPGIGNLSVHAVVNSDLPVIMGVTLFAAFFIIFANFVVDLLYAVLDPKVRLG